MRRIRLLPLLLVLLGGSQVSAADLASTNAPLRVIYPQPETENDPRARYPLSALELALQASGSDYRLQPSAAPMHQTRALLLLEQGQSMDVVWSAPSVAREQRLRAVPIAIDRGLIGWRVLLIRHGDAGRFAAVKTLADLRALRGIQGHDWPDLGTLRNNGLDVSAGSSFSGLFAMLVRGRVDYFPRAVSEVLLDVEMHPDMALEIEPRLLLYYPSGMYLFVNKNNPRLAEALHKGLQQATTDGRLQALFDATYSGLFKKLSIGQRRVLRLRNPDLPASMRAEHPGFWYPGEVGR
ncbi:MAG: hypothetical protein CVV12_03075 [Gammaproteobacteria bacterium HGW-Gammaproteobacteria-2]|jgi:hypothetical protein|nr:MAG: hypothetical protein CVV12_03075 [Gammaproteobacteria bacterium HGW-Gammaproteobacteria-2]